MVDGGRKASSIRRRHHPLLRPIRGACRGGNIRAGQRRSGCGEGCLSPSAPQYRSRPRTRTSRRRTQKGSAQRRFRSPARAKRARRSGDGLRPITGAARCDLHPAGGNSQSDRVPRDRGRMGRLDLHAARHDAGSRECPQRDGPIPRCSAGECAHHLEISRVRFRRQALAVAALRAGRGRRPRLEPAR